MENGDMGVNNADANTAATSPAADQTVNDTTANTGEQNQGTQAADSKTPETVPYERLSETTQKLRQTEETMTQMQKELQELKQSRAQTPVNTANVDPQQTAMKEKVKEALKPMLEEMGYVSKEELQRREIDRIVESKVQALEKELDGSDGRPKFERAKVYEYAHKTGIPDPQAAYKLLHEKELIQWHTQQAIKGSRGLQTETSNGSGSQQAGTSNADLKAEIAKGNKTALHTYLKRNLPFKSN